MEHDDAHAHASASTTSSDDDDEGGTGDGSLAGGSVMSDAVLARPCARLPGHGHGHGLGGWPTPGLGGGAAAAARAVGGGHGHGHGHHGGIPPHPHHPNHPQRLVGSGGAHQRLRGPKQPRNYDVSGASCSPGGHALSNGDVVSPSGSSPVVVDYMGAGSLMGSVYGRSMSPMQMGTPPIHHHLQQPPAGKRAALATVAQHHR